jgi:LuxR family maltose regulon positive regulatory protein
VHSSFIATKVRIPPQRDHLVPRASLSEALERGILTSRFALVTAPAGYGKTTLLGQWARASRLRVAWLSLEAAENDLERFLRYLVTAWDEVQPGIKETPVGLLLGSTTPDIDTVLSEFINVGSAISDDTVFVLDDCHLIQSEAIFQALTFLIDHLSPHLHFMLAGRSEPPLPLARYRAHGDVLELGLEHLRFRDEETRAFLSHLLPAGISDDALALLHASLEGWIGGLQLACHALRRRPQSMDLAAISGKHRFITDYLHEEVLAALDESTRRFLLRTSILDQVHGELCDAVIGRTDSQQTLERLEREGLFLAALDDVREWFRFHPLFRGVLRAELDRRHPDELASLQRRAARWYQDHAMPEQAFHHAVAGNDPALVTQIGEDYCVIKMESGELSVVGQWMQLIPEAWFTTYPLISLLKVAFLIYTGAFEDSAALLNSVEDRIRRSTDRDRRQQLARVATVRCAIACFQNDLSSAEVHASEALGELPEVDGFYRASIYHALGETYARNAYWAQAKDSFLAALNIVHAPSSRIRSVHIYGALADLELRQGHLETAAEYWSSALGAIREREMWGRLPIPVTGWVSVRMGELFYERNHLAEAWDHIAKGLELAQAGGDVRTLIAGYILSARLKLTEGEIELATQYLDQARPVLQQAKLPEWVSRYERYQLELWLAQDRLRAVGRWIAAAAAAPGQQQGDSEPDHLTLARALIVRGDQPGRDQAADILRRLIDATAAEGQKGIQIEALALQALGLWAVGDGAGALTSLQRALRLAEPEGYVRVFADLGLPMVELLHEARARDVMPDYVQTIIGACAPDLALQSSVSAPRPEPLSEREQEVLGLIAAGLTNREIAEHLFISAETVKKHASSIYAKLDVGRRTEAVARAGDLGILDHLQ